MCHLRVSSFIDSQTDVFLKVLCTFIPKGIEFWLPRPIWSQLNSVDTTLQYGKVYRAASMQDLVELNTFLSHCCHSRHYSFSIKKCGEDSCTICRPVHMPLELFRDVHHLPDPVPGEEGHYTPFSDVYGTSTTEQHRPSLQARKGRQKTLPFSGSVQHVKNVDVMVQCEECLMWRLLYCKHKLSASARKSLQRALDDVTYTCGAQLQDLQLGDRFAEVFVRQIRCSDLVEKLYYSVGKYQPVCIHCCSEDSLTNAADCYPQCPECVAAGKEPIKKRK